MDEVSALRMRMLELEAQLYRLQHATPPLTNVRVAAVPEEVISIFDEVQAAVGAYFHELMFEPEMGTIGVSEQRYILIRAASLSKGFLDTVQKLYADRGVAEANRIGRNFLFDFSHVIGMSDARALHNKLGFQEAISRMAAGPVHFAYTGWAFVEILPESELAGNDDFCVVYRHPYSFEADSWIKAGERSEAPVCIMNAGYSSGWCTESFGMPLTSVEVSCRARGDAECCFVMAPPHRIEARLKDYQQIRESRYDPIRNYDIPSFFERKKMEEEMKHARLLAEASVKAKSDFIANISHELRTPLGALLGFTELLERTLLSPQQKDYIDAIQTAGENLLALINDLLDMSKLDAGQLTISQVPFNIRDTIQDVAVMFGPRASEKGLNLVCEIDPSLSAYVKGDAIRLTQILTNLVGNAVKFTESGSVRLEVKVKPDDNPKLQRLVFCVADTGIGIPEEQVPIIFDRFTQADTHIARKYGGTGLGLAITRQLVALQRGLLKLDYSSPQGTRFRVELEYQTCGQPEAAPPPENHNGNNHSEQTLLVVEDNVLVRKLAEIVLKQAGYRLSFAEQGQQAIELINQKRFDLILMDVQMPILDGYATTRIIREELKMDIPIIAMTAHVSTEEKEICLRHGMNDYIAKPFTAAILLEKVLQWLNHNHNHNSGNH